MTQKGNAVQCTHCGVHTAIRPIWQKAHMGRIEHGAYMQSGNIIFVQCAACALTIVVDFSEGKVVWPLVAAHAPKGVPHVVEEAYSDAMLALAVGSKIGALMAMRSMGDRLLRDGDAKTFSQLAGKGVITPAQYGVLDQNRLWANVFGHEDIRTDRIDLAQIAELFQFVRTILETIYTQPKAAERFAELTKEFEQNN